MREFEEARKQRGRGGNQFHQERDVFDEEPLPPPPLPDLPPFNPALYATAANSDPWGVASVRPQP